MKQFLAVTLCLTLAACGSKNSASSSSSGGGSSTTSIPSGEATLEIPEGAFEGPATVTATSSDPAKVPGRISVGRLWDVRVNGAEHTEFLKPALIRVPFDTSKVPAGKGVMLMTNVDGRWRPLASSRVEDGFVVAAVMHLSGHQPVLVDEEIRVVARWFGQTVMETHRGETLFGPPNGVASPTAVRRTAFIVAREEALRGPWGGDTSRFVIENAGVGIALNEHTGVTKDGRHLIFNDAVNSSVSAPGEAMARHAVDIDRKLDEWREELEKLELELARAVEARDNAADRETANGEISTLQSRVTEAKDNLRTQEFYAGAMSTSSFHAQLNDGMWTVSAQCENKTFEYTHPGYDIGGPIGDDKHLPYEQGGPRKSQVSLTTHFEAYGPAGTTISATRESGTADNHFLETTTFTRVPVDSNPGKELRVAGQLLYRIHVPKGTTENWIGASPTQTWADLKDLAIPVAGKAFLEAFLLEPAEMIERGAANTTVTKEDATFELKVPMAPMKILRLRMTWESRDAQLRETCELDVPLWQVVAARESIKGAGTAPVTAIQRRSTARLRYAKAPKDFTLGQEVRGATVVKDAQGVVSLEFRELESLLLGSMVRTATHINQNRNSFKVRVADRHDEILARCPQALLQEVQDRLAAEAADGTTEVSFAGSEVCYPTSTLMALDSIQKETIALDAAGATTQLADLAQAIYDNAEAMRTGAVVADRVVWIDIPVPSKAQADRADALIAQGRTRDAEAILAEFRKTWPFSAELKHNKYWLLSTLVAGDDFRPWQVPRIMNAGLKARYPGIEVPRIEIMVDPFLKPGSRDLVEKLGAGGSGVVSISHLSGLHGAADKKTGARHFDSKKGGHLLCLLGVVMKADGTLVRVVVHDPHGDLTQNPEFNGYYDPRDWFDNQTHTEVQDVDNTGHLGTFAPYGPDPDPVRAYEDTIKGKYIVPMRASGDATTPEAVRKRLVPGVR